jgi:hypothetical protein
MIERRVLDHAEDALKKARLLARTERFAVLAAPSDLLVKGEHEKVFLFYAFIVDPADGRLSVLLWAYTADRERPLRLSMPVLLPPRDLFSCGLDVKAERLLGAVPVNWKFAMCSLPAGERVSIPAAERPWFTDAARIAAQPHAFEAVVRGLVPQSPARTSAPQATLR